MKRLRAWLIRLLAHDDMAVILNVRIEGKTVFQPRLPVVLGNVTFSGLKDQRKP